MYRARLIIAIVVAAAALIGVGLYFQQTGETPEPGEAVHPATPDAGGTAVSGGREEWADPVTVEAPSADIPVVAEETVPPPRNLRIYGVVLDAATDAPVVGAALTIAPPVAGLEAVETDVDGGYSLEVNLPVRAAGSAVTCMATGYRRTNKTINAPVETTENDAPAELRMDFYLKTGAVITGRVTDARTGVPVEGIRVTATVGGGSFMERMMSMKGDAARASTDETGRYTIEGLEPAAYLLLADGSEAGYVVDASATKSISFPEDKAEIVADFQLTLGGTVRGAVTTPDGTAPEALQVLVMPSRGFSDLTSDMFSGGAGSMMRFRPLEANVEENGAYLAKGLSHDREYRVSARAKGFAGAVSASFKVTAGKPEAVIDLTLQRGSTVSGKAVYEDGTPVAQRKLMLFPDLGDIMSGSFAHAGSDFKQQTDDKGLFSFEAVPAGKYTLMPEPGDEDGFPMVYSGSGNRVTVEVDGVKDTRGVKLVLQRSTGGPDGAQAEGGIIEGKVIAPDGTPAANITVTAKGVAAEFDPTSMMAEPASARTDEQGAFKLDSLDKERYDLRVKSDLGNTEEAGVSVGSTVTLRLNPPTRLRGQVFDVSHEPVANCNVSLKSTSEEGFNIMALMGMGVRADSSETDEFGFFEFANAVPGEYTLEAKSRTSGTGVTQPFTVVAGKDLLNLDIVLTPGVAFGGRVLDGAGRPIENATVTLQPTAGRMAAAMNQFLPATMRQQAGTAQSGADGVYEILRVPPGTYTVNATHADFAPTNLKDVLVEAGHDVRGFDLVLNVGGCIEGVTVLKGEVRSNIMIQVMGDGGMFMTSSDDEGKFELCGIPEGTYIVQAVDAGSVMSGDLGNMQFKQVSIEILDGQTTTVDFAPPENTATVSGIIGGELGTITQVSLRRPGGPAPEELDPLDMQAQMSAAAYQAGTAMADAQGVFTMEGIEPGDYILEVFSFTINPGDIQAMVEMDRTPQIRMEVTVEEGRDVHLELSLPAATP